MIIKQKEDTFIITPENTTHAWKLCFSSDFIKCNIKSESNTRISVTQFSTRIIYVFSFELLLYTRVRPITCQCINWIQQNLPTTIQKAWSPRSIRLSFFTLTKSSRIKFLEKTKNSFEYISIFACVAFCSAVLFSQRK